MKRITLLVLIVASSVMTYGQKTEKPNLNKALKSLQDNKLDEAKSNIDLATTYEKTKDDGKTWYYRGLIYAAIDTSKNTTFNHLAENPLATAMESFAKADQLGKPDKEYSTQAPTAILPDLKPQQIERLANFYLDKSIKLFQQGEDYKAALEVGQKSQLVFENGLKKYANDTLAYYVLGLCAQNLDQNELAATYFIKDMERGGKGKEIYLLLYQLYNGPLEKKDKALEIVKKGHEKFPANTDFPKLEIGLLIDLDKIQDAKTGLEAEVAKDPNNKTIQFFLGYVNSKLEIWEEAKKQFNAALKLDPTYFEAQYYLAQVYYIDAIKVKKEMDGLGITPSEKKRKLELDKVVVEKYQAAVPYWEKAEQIKPNDQDVLDKLSALYYFLGEDSKLARVNKKKKELGFE